MPTILVADDDAELLGNLVEFLTEEGFGVVAASAGAAAISLAKAHCPDVIVCDVGMPGTSGHDVLRAIRAHPATTRIPFIFLSAKAERSDVRLGMDLGADDYLTKPFGLEELQSAIAARLERSAELRRLADAVGSEDGSPARGDRMASGVVGLPGVVATDPSTQRLFATCARVARTRLTVLISGETGSGKEIVARAVHAGSERASGPFVALNCAGLSETMLEAELFGHERGAFTGASHSRAGLLETAHHGTVFLDEVAELPLTVQAKLLRVLEDRKIRRIGGRLEKEVDLRFVAATHRDLAALVRDAKFREDLYFRLKGELLHVPPLRERPADILPLARAFVARASVEQGRKRQSISPEAERTLLAYQWPGNVRELRNALERAVAFSDGPTLDLTTLPREVRGESLGIGPPSTHREEELLKELSALERRRVERALTEAGGNQSAAAQSLGISRRTLVYRLTALGLTRSRRG